MASFQVSRSGRVDRWMDRRRHFENRYRYFYISVMSSSCNHYIRRCSLLVSNLFIFGTKLGLNINLNSVVYACSRPKCSHVQIFLNLPRRSFTIKKAKQMGGHRLRFGEKMPRRIPKIWKNRASLANKATFSVPLRLVALHLTNRCLT